MNCPERASRTIRVEPKIMQVLLTLADHPGEVVSERTDLPPGMAGYLRHR